jgi:singapore isolate B (sub-type 7) whole genome shotgun sequence assembly, scaffold_2
MQKYASAQSREYDQGVVEVLKEELMGTTKDFRKVLEVREEFFLLSRLVMRICKRQTKEGKNLVLLHLLY